MYQFAYTVDGSGNITQADITDPRGSVERLVFNSNHYITSDTQAYGTTLARTTTTERLGRSNLVTAVVDALIVDGLKRAGAVSGSIARSKDRLVNELRVAGITTLAAANHYVTDQFVPQHNATFARASRDPATAFVPLGAADLDGILRHQEDRVVARDNTVTMGGQVLQIAA